MTDSTKYIYIKKKDNTYDKFRDKLVWFGQLSIEISEKHVLPL